MVARTGASAPHDHAVNFYDHDAEIVAEVAGFIAEGLERGERVIVIATGDHRAAVEEVLLQHETDAVRARLAGRYLTFDVAETLAMFMVDGTPDAGRFEASIGGVLAVAAEDGCPIRVFGEMVALLWQQGNVAGAIELEALWNALAKFHRFSLLCAYSASVLGDGQLTEVNRVCELHSGLQPPRSYASGMAGAGSSDGATQRSQLYVPVPAAVSAVRRFVSASLRSWGEDELISDAVMVASELATNAVRHAASAFRATVSRRGSLVRIAIEDVGVAQPELQRPAPEEFRGRGVAIVDELCHRWGCDPLPHGKVVWGEFPSAALAPELS